MEGTINSLLADSLQVDSDLRLQGVQVTGSGEKSAIRLPGAQIGGTLDLSGAKIANCVGLALFADGLRVDSNLRFEGVQAAGPGKEVAIRLVGARVGGQLDLSGTTIMNDDGYENFRRSATGAAFTIYLGVWQKGNAVHTVPSRANW